MFKIYNYFQTFPLVFIFKNNRGVFAYAIYFWVRFENGVDNNYHKSRIIKYFHLQLWNNSKISFRK